MKTFQPLPFFFALAGLASAQSATPPVSPSAEEPFNLEAIVVTGSPFARAQDEIAPPTTLLGGRRLNQKRQLSLGETLAGEPGIGSTYFGPGASRPVIRGLGGDRIRVLTGGIGTIDASIISPDHAVSIDPMLIDRIEVVRGPATLLYGGAAIGGVVNMLDGRVPETLPPAALGGRFELRGVTGIGEESAAGIVTGRAGRIAWRLDGFHRDTDDIRIPGFAESEAFRAAEAMEGGPGEDHAHGRLPNSATASSGASLGVSFIGERGHLGVSYNGFDSLYGVPGHEHHEEEGETGEGVRIDLRQRRWDIHGEMIQPATILRAIKLQLGFADYLHRELEGGETGTRFTNQGYEGRLEFLHEKAGPLEGALGLQSSRSDFAAEGDEAFLPPSRTENNAVFLFEELAAGRVTWQFGARLERQKITPEAGSGFGSRSHTGASLSGGLVWSVSKDYALALSLTRNERLPNAQELFAQGPHAGTNAFEIGDPTLDGERSTGFDFSLRRRRGFVTGALSLFLNDFTGYVFEQNTGTVDPDEGLPVYRFVQRDARLHGGELELVFHLHDTKTHQADLRLIGDYVRGDNRSDGTPLPRITPARLGAGFDWRGPQFMLNAEIRHVGRMGRVSGLETVTSGYGMINVGGSWFFDLDRGKIELFVQATNLGDQEARNHSSFLKDIAPLPGRSVAFGMRVAF